MQKFKIQFGMIAMFIAVLFLSSCGNSATTDNAEGEATETTEATDGESAEAAEATEGEGEGEGDGEAEAAGPEITSVYVCPMHCDGSGSAEAGTCPACEMDYVFNKPYHSAYICPMHCKDSGSEEAGTCPACEMDYVANEHAGHSHG
jgi:hypothetical protein